MLDWVAPILGEAYSPETEKQIAAQIGKSFVAKSDFQAVKEENKQLKTTLQQMDEQLKTLKTETEGVEALRQSLRERDETILQMQQQAEQDRRQNAVCTRLRELGVRDPDYVLYKKGGIDRFSFDEQGNPTQLEELTEALRRDPVTEHLFISAAGQYVPSSGSAGVVNPFAKESFNLTEQGRLLRENPAAARQLAAAAKVPL